MSIKVKRILNSPVDSNSFVVYKNDNNFCIIIDPGTRDCKELLKFIEKEKLLPEYIILTHEHFDHVWGVNRLKEIYDSTIICSRECSLRIIEKKKNMSVFYDQIGFEAYPADIVIEDLNNHLKWRDIDIEFIITKGHTNSSICVNIGDILFTGDTIIKNLKTVVKLPGGNKELLVMSLNLIFSKFKDSLIIVYPGHGEKFILDSIKISELV